ncbi:MAG: hypothetical protein IKC71_00110 [Clostridia bacterium]|nr:hypothetical protein [Clostridia bacterium]
METNYKKAKTIILSITLSLAVFFIIIGSVIVGGTKGSANNPIRLYEDNPKRIHAEYGEGYYYTYKSDTSGYYYIYIDGAQLYDVAGATGTVSTAYREIYNGYTYDYRYEVYLSGYNTDHRILVESRTSSKIRIVIVKQ